jgi:DNA-binding GntR family transcriptional regulator
MPPAYWELAVREHVAFLNALQRRDGEGLSHILRRHLRRKHHEVEDPGFAEDPAFEQLPDWVAQRAST